MQNRGVKKNGEKDGMYWTINRELGVAFGEDSVKPMADIVITLPTRKMPLSLS
jgi:hypothetical protein